MYCRYSLVEANSSTLQTFVDKGFNRDARLHTQMVGQRLNRLSRLEHTRVDNFETDGRRDDGDGGGVDDVPSRDGVRYEEDGQSYEDKVALRRKIRRAMIVALKDLPLRDQVCLQCEMFWCYLFVILSIF